MADGWKCPSCGRCYAPAVTQCRWCGPDAFIDFSRVKPRAWGDTCPSCNCTPCAHTTTGCRPLPPPYTVTLDATPPTASIGKITFSVPRT